jgi:hypothetical protein
MGVAEVRRLKRLVADLSLDKAILHDALRNGLTPGPPWAGRVRTRCLSGNGATCLSMQECVGALPGVAEGVPAGRDALRQVSRQFHGLRAAGIHPTLPRAS